MKCSTHEMHASHSVLLREPDTTRPQPKHLLGRAPHGGNLYTIRSHIIHGTCVTLYIFNKMGCTYCVQTHKLPQERFSVRCIKTGYARLEPAMRDSSRIARPFQVHRRRSQIESVEGAMLPTPLRFGLAKQNQL